MVSGTIITIIIKFKLVVAYVVTHDLRIAKATGPAMPHRTLVDRNMQLSNTAIAILLAGHHII